MASLEISDKDKYGDSSSNSPLAGPSRPEDRKSVPTVEIVGPQVEAFDLLGCKVGDEYTGTVKFKVKAMSMGSKYGNDVPGAKSKAEVTLALTDIDDVKVVGDEDDEGDEPAGDEGEEADPADEEPAAGSPAESDEPTEDSGPAKRDLVRPGEL